MAPTIPTTEPTKFVAGDTVCWSKTLADYPADEYELSYAFVKDGEQFTVTCTADGTDHYAEMDTTESDVDPGEYRWQSYATDLGDSERYFVASGLTEVVANYAAASSGFDARTDAETMLDALNATLVGKASQDQLMLSIQGRTLQRLTPAELLKWRDTMKSEVRRQRMEEKAAQGLDLGNKIRVRF